MGKTPCGLKFEVHLPGRVYLINCFSHSRAAPSLAKLFMGIGGGFKPNKIFMINFESPGFEIIAIAE